MEDNVTFEEEDGQETDDNDNTDDEVEFVTHIETNKYGFHPK